MEDRGFFLTLQAIRRQLAAMPNELYLVRLIHTGPGRRSLVNGFGLPPVASAATIRFLRVRNREGCDVYVQPYAGDQNAGYILVDLDHARPRPSTPCAPTGMTPVWSCRPAPAICKPGFVSVPRRWNRRWRPPPANCWRQPMAAIRPARIGVTWAGWPVSPTRSPRDAHRGGYAPG